MSFVNTNTAQAFADLRGAHYTFPRAQKLREGFEWMLTDYWSKALLGRRFEARGLLVTGPSRTGKSAEIEHLLAKVNDGETAMPDGRPAKIVSVMLAGTMTWKDLGVHTLREGLHLPTRGKMTQTEIWDMVGFQARAQGVHGIHYDECQHIFPRKSVEGRAMILDSFKSLLKNPDWPLMLVLSGVDELVGHIASEEQLAYLLRPVQFQEISLQRSEDRHELNSLCFAYADKAGVDFSGLSTLDFFRRLTCACGNRWGLVIELLIDACVEAQTATATALTPKHFCRAFTARTGLTPGYSPFSIETFEPLFKGEKMFELWENKRMTAAG
ncbi:ATP-binding protein [Paenirhodobacter populi]|uniref:ATP-binding protein n=1 Tax=Paenirhodobacter populi TaxID=2306993 RepID=UPI0013E35550|nr:ATP-binding protein [Sinirhodobacter populi]